jgi:TolA-binding protein
MNGNETMKPCHNLQTFLLGGLSGAGRTEFEAHLDGCGACRDEVSTWGRVDETLKRWSDARAVPEASPFVGKHLVQMAEESKQRAPVSRARRPLVLATASALAAAAAVALVLVISGEGTDDAAAPAQPIAPRLVFTDGGEILSRPGSPDAELTVAGEGRLLAQIAADRIALGPRSNARLARARDGGLRIDLVRGAVTIAAAKKAGNETLSVAAGRHRVVVVGTRFSVAIPQEGDLKVAVSHGVVRVVTEDGAERFVERGQAFEVTAGKERLTELREDLEQAMEELLAVPEDPGATDTAHARAEIASSEPQIEPAADSGSDETKPANPRPGTADRLDLNDVRAWILAGELDRAESALDTRLRRHPRDVKAWNLLANCNRKAGNFGDAVAGYRKVIEYGNAGQSNRARFQAATVLQDRLGGHSAAAALLEAYLERPTALKPLEAEAMLRLARALLRLGSKVRAYRTLEQIQDRFPGTNAALKARRLLDERADG